MTKEINKKTETRILKALNIIELRAARGYKSKYDGRKAKGYFSEIQEKAKFIRSLLNGKG